MDALSDLLRVIRLSGGVFLDAEFSAPWCIAARVGPEDCRAAMVEPAHLIAFHFVVAGKALLQVAGEAPVPLHGGMIVLLPHNDAHTLGSEPGLQPVIADDLVSPDPDGGLARIVFGGGGDATHIVCGFIGTDVRHHPLIDALPRTLVLDLNGKPACEWIRSSFRYAAGEHATIRAGSAIMLARLSELLFVETVRCYVDTLPGDRRGWLAGLRDPVVGRAVALMHTQLSRAWTSEQLAAEVFLSRSAFADRFVALMGVPPMKYLAAWRMQVAAQRLRECHRSVAQIAGEVGYESEEAFTRAFKRTFGVSPSIWRRYPNAQPAPEQRVAHRPPHGYPARRQS